MPTRGRPRLSIALGATTAALAAMVAAALPVSAATQTVSVLYAGSLASINDQVLGPAFQKAEGVVYQGTGNGSLALAQEIVGNEITGDLFESVGTAAIAAVGPTIMPWAVPVASQPLVVMYNPKSKWAPEFRAIAEGKKPLKDLFTLLETPGLKLGRTDPETDPQGQAFVLMVHLATKLYGLPADTPSKVLGAVENPNEVFNETTLPSEVQSGAIDASSGFLPQAMSLKLPYVALPPSLDFADGAQAKTYAEASVVLPNGTKVVGAPLAIWAGPLFESGSHTGLGVRFLEFIDSRTGQALMRKYGFSSVNLAVYGRSDLVPAALDRELKANAEAASK